jgi:DNA-binding NarL/FixJ family response regulator
VFVIKQLVFPFIDRLKALPANKQSRTYLNIIETNLGEILSPLIGQLSSTFKKLPPKEVQIAGMIRQGKNSKEIAEMFESSVATINTHRNNIRRKLDLKKKKANLRSHLLSLS